MPESIEVVYLRVKEDKETPTKFNLSMYTLPVAGKTIHITGVAEGYPKCGLLQSGGVLLYSDISELTQEGADQTFWVLRNGDSFKMEFLIASTGYVGTYKKDAEYRLADQTRTPEGPYTVEYSTESSDSGSHGQTNIKASETNILSFDNSVPASLAFEPTLTKFYMLTGIRYPDSPQLGAAFESSSAEGSLPKGRLGRAGNFNFSTFDVFKGDVTYIATNSDLLIVTFYANTDLTQALGQFVGNAIPDVALDVHGGAEFETFNS